MLHLRFETAPLAVADQQHYATRRRMGIHGFAACIKFGTLSQRKCMNEKPIDWRGSSLRDIKDDDIFTPNARKEAGHQLGLVQVGLDPDDWKPFDVVGAGTKEIRINLDDGWFRVMYVAKFAEAVYVLHCFKKKTSTTSKKDKDITAARYKAVIQERSKK